MTGTNDVGRCKRASRLPWKGTLLAFVERNTVQYEKMLVCERSSYYIRSNAIVL